MELSQAPAARAVQCPQCQQVLVGGDAQANGSERCPKCRSELRVWRFPPCYARRKNSIPREALRFRGRQPAFFIRRKGPRSPVSVVAGLSVLFVICRLATVTSVPVVSAAGWIPRRCRKW